MLLSEILKEGTERFIEDLILIEAAIDLEVAIADSAKVQNFNDKVKVIYSKYISELNSRLKATGINKENFYTDKERERFDATNKRFDGFKNLRPEGYAVIYNRYWEDNKARILAAIEQKLKTSNNTMFSNLLSTPVTNNNNVSVKIEPEELVPLEKDHNKNLTQSAVLIKMFNDYKKNLGTKNWIKENIDVKLIDGYNTLPKMDFTVLNGKGKGFAIETKTSQTIVKFENSFKYASFFSPASAIKTLRTKKEKNDFEIFFKNLKTVLFETARKQVEKTIKECQVENHLFIIVNTNDPIGGGIYKTKSVEVTKAKDIKDKEIEKGLHSSWQINITINKNEDKVANIGKDSPQGLEAGYEIEKKRVPPRLGTGAAGINMENALRKNENLYNLIQNSKIPPGDVSDFKKHIKFEFVYKKNGDIGTSYVKTICPALETVLETPKEHAPVTETRKKILKNIGNKIKKGYSKIEDFGSHSHNLNPVFSSIDTMKEEAMIKDLIKDLMKETK